MARSVESLLRLLKVEQIDGDLYRGEQPNVAPQRMFGGQVLGQALSAAYRSVPDDRHLHSLHAYFILPGDTSHTVLFDVEKLRDGRSFTTRRTAAVQHGRPIFYMTTSFQVDEPGPDHQDPPPDLGGDPENLPTLGDYIRTRDDLDDSIESPFGAIDVRLAGFAQDGTLGDSGYPSVARVWMRVIDTLPDRRALHDCALAYMSDMTLLPASLVPHGLHYQSGEVQTASLDHAMWFHRPFRADEWLLYDQVSPSASGARGLSMGRVFDRAGHLVATAMQEGLTRPMLPRI
ncbi:MAG: Choloyl-CoA hydrolase [Pseudonocardiales bacterium]|nr:Choloyl-CoA hydrolase [Pseudonocardiales bacterium]